VRITTVACDRCRRVVESDMAVIKCLGILEAPVGRADLCDPCARELLDWLRSAQKNESARERALDDLASASI
jgi:hypothetical protein